MSNGGRPMKTKGLRPYRFKDNPEEKRFAEAWAKQCENGKVLDHLLDERPVQQGYPPSASLRDEVVAATIIQWLGSPVGQYFLGDLGYEKGGSGVPGILPEPKGARQHGASCWCANCVDDEDEKPSFEALPKCLHCRRSTDKIVGKIFAKNEHRCCGRCVGSSRCGGNADART